MSYSTTTVVLYLLIDLVSDTVKWVLLAKGAWEVLSTISETRRWEIVTQEDFMEEQKGMACNWHADRARSSQNTTYTIIYKKIKQKSYVCNLLYNLLYIHK